jgi:hypothetical protein
MPVIAASATGSIAGDAAINRRTSCGRNIGAGGKGPVGMWIALPTVSF